MTSQTSTVARIFHVTTFIIALLLLGLTPEAQAQDIAANPASHDYGEVMIGGSASQTFVVSNEESGDDASAEACATVDFETIPGATPEEGLRIDTQFLDSLGFSFSLEGEEGEIPRLAEVGRPTTAFQPADRPAPDQNTGSFFLTDDGIFSSSLTTPPLVVSFASPTDSASGVVLDIDFSETFTIEARGAANEVLEEVVITAGDPGTGSTLATPWAFKRNQADVFSIRFVGTRTAAGGFGLGFDNFTTCVPARAEPATLEVSATELAGDDADEFAIESGGGSFSLAPGASRDLVVSYNPTSEGAKNAVLRLASNDPDENPLDVALLGTGAAAPSEEDTTPPVCGPINVERNAEGALAAVSTSASDAESGIAEVAFTTLQNLDGFAGEMGPYAQGDVATFDAEATERVTIRGERLDFSRGGAILTTVTNGAGLTATCDPVVEQLSAEVPQRFSLQGNAPNPFRTTTRVGFSLAEAAPVTLEVYDLLGRKVTTLMRGEQLSASTYEVAWDGRDAAGRAVESGVYFYRLEAGSFSATRRMTVVR